LALTPVALLTFLNQQWTHRFFEEFDVVRRRAGGDRVKSSGRDGKKAGEDRE
jgi:hypothetical protein